jgi:hypothetical protein
VRAFCDSSIEPTIAPVQQAKAIDLAIIPWRFDQTLSTPPFAGPNTRKRRVKSHLHLILQIEVSTWQKGEHVFHIGGKLTPQISLDQVMNG